MVDAVVAALQHRPKTLYAVRVRLTVHVLRYRVLHRLVVLQAHVAAAVVGVRHRAGLAVRLDEALERDAIGALDNPGPHAVRMPILRTHHRRLAHGATTGVLALAGVLVLLLAAHVRLVNLHRAIELLRRVAPRLADAVQHEPCGGLTHAQIAVQLHARHALQVRQAHVDRERPLPVRHLRALKRRAHLGAEIPPAIPAPVGHLLVLHRVCPFRRCRPPIPPSRSQIPEHTDHLGRAEVRRGAGGGVEG